MTYFLRPTSVLKAWILAVLLLCGEAPGYSQLVAFGVKAGVPLTDGLRSGGGYDHDIVLTKTQRWLVGPTVEVHLPFRISLEVDALYRRESYTDTSTIGLLVPTNRYSVSNWQIPFLAKYDLHGGLVRPFIDGGVTYRHLSGGVDKLNAAGITVAGAWL